MTTAWEGLSPPYATIVADPPWRYYGNGGGSKGDPSRRYSTLSFREVAELPVADIAAPDAHLYLWATCPFIYGDRQDGGPSPVEIMEAWGFRFVTLITWAKRSLGLGHFFRTNTEHALFGVKGHCPIPPDLRRPNVIDAGRGRHSVKPAAFFDLVEAVSPGPRLELFCRSPRMGWDSWGHGYELSGASA